MTRADDRPASRLRTTLGRRRFVGASTAVLAGAVVTACGSAAEPTSDTAPSGEGTSPGPGAVDVGFFSDMAVHHEQALAMCQRVLGTDAGDPVQAAAAEILQNQSFERGLMFAWLQSWGESTAPPEVVMGWMGMAMPRAEMPGLASDEEMRDLAQREGSAKGRAFLELMRAHHVGGVHMAEAAAGADTEPVRRLAAQMVATQSYEIEVFDGLLATSYAEA